MRERVLDYLRELGFVVDLESSCPLALPSEDKETLRKLHGRARHLALLKRQAWIKRSWPRLSPHLARGEDLAPERVRPVLVEVAKPWHEDLFLLARLTWSLPYSKGYGRRLRFLLLDVGNTGPGGEPLLMGVLGLQSPPLSFPPRDRYLEYAPGRKVEMVNQTMDVYTLGALPPYSALLGGKLVALAAASNEVREAYVRKYAHRRTELDGRLLPPHLVALTTTSAFGRSSLYNRLKYRGEPIAISLGYTEGYGTFHLEELYPLFRQFLEAHGVSTRGGYGVGPRIKWQTCVRAFERLGLPSSLLRHALKREAFLFPLVHNLEAYMRGEDGEPVYRDLPFDRLADYWKERWLLPRALRVEEWRNWEPERLLENLLVE